MFLWLLGALAREGFTIGGEGESDRRDRIDAGGLYAITRESLRRLRGWCAAGPTDEPTGLNLVLTDGRLMTAVRFGRTLWTQSQPIANAGRSTIVVASEPTDELGPWRELDDRSILTVDASGRLLVRPL